MDENRTNSDLDVEELLAKFEKQLDEIETQEILRDMMPESLAEKGLMGEKPSPASKTKITQTTEKEHLVFEPGVEFERLGDSVDFETVDVGSLLHIADIENGKLIAIRSVDEKGEFHAGRNVSEGYLDGTVRFCALVRGKPVIIGNTLHVVPSDADAQVTIRVDDRKMNVRIDCTPGRGSGRQLSGDFIREELKLRDVVYGIKDDVIAVVVAEAGKKSTSIRDILIAEGTMPVPEKPGPVEYKFDTRPKEYDFTILPDGRIDYRKSKNILTAVKDQLLAHLGASKPGIPGRTVCNDVILPPEPASVLPALVAGNGVRVSDDGRDFFAEISGCILHNGSCLEVVNTYVVDGDVDFATGNIFFNGNVVVCGTVLDGFEIKADGDIIVSKIVESATLTAGRDVIVKGGVLGRGKGLVSAGRDIRIGYAQNARLEAQGSIYIGNYASNSYIATSKQLIMQQMRGAVIGGDVFALGGIDVRVLGSENGIKTSVEAGTDFLVMRTIKEMDDVISFCEENIRKIDDSFKYLNAKLDPDRPIPAVLKQSMKKAMGKRRDLEKRKAMVGVKRADLLNNAMEKGPCFVKVKDTCYTDVKIRIKEFFTHIAMSRQRVRFFSDEKLKEIGTGVY